MESIVRPLLFIYSKTSSTRSKFNYHSNYSPSSTIIYVTRTLILKRRSAHRCVLSRFDFKGVAPQSIPYLLVAIQNHGRSKISRRSLEGKRGRGRKRRRFLFHGSRGCTPGSIFILVVENFQGKRGWSREIWRAGFDLKWKWRSAGGENKRCPGVNYEARRGEGEKGGSQRGRQFRESAGKTLFRRWSIFKGVIEQATTIVHRWLIWFCLFFDALWISRLHFSCFSLSRFAFVCWIVIWIFSGKETSSKVSIWLAFCRECVWIKLYESFKNLNSIRSDKRELSLEGFYIGQKDRIFFERIKIVSFSLRRSLVRGWKTGCVWRYTWRICGDKNWWIYVWEWKIS